jgi:prolyl-tRNA synthetase
MQGIHHERRLLFDVDASGADKSYEIMYDAYTRIFQRCGLMFRPVEADSGSIGGSYSHEFMVLADTGEDEIINCLQCDYAANLEKAEVKASGPNGAGKDSWENLGRSGNSGCSHHWMNSHRSFPFPRIVF